MSRLVFLALVASTALVAAQYSTGRPSLSCGVGELPDNCPNSCYEPACGDNGMQLCAGLLKCDPPKCVCDRSLDYARDPSSGKCVKRADCPAWTTNPCMLAKCSAGHVCENQNGKAVCVKTESTVEPYPVTLNACAATTCMVGSICVEDNGVGRCVAPPGSENNNCTVKFEEWKQCASCEPTCENKTPFCNKMCQPPRCQCRQGFFRNKEGQCVTENDCDTAAMTPSPTTCSRRNEEYRECASACEPTCKTKDQEIMCIAMCMPGACQCKVGFYRADNGDCVTARQCTRPPRDPAVPSAPSTQCKKNEGFSSCSSMCEPQCGQYEPLMCILMCGPPKCQCNSGFFRHANGECMTRAECEKNPAPTKPTCKKNQIYSECSSACIPKCGEFEVRPCMLMCGPPKCECDRGFYLDSRGECVTRQECEAQSGTPKTPSQADCNPNEKFTECSTQCEEKCNEVLTRACPASCGPPKCQCDIGFFRNSVGDCVSKSDCELDTPITCANIDCVSGMICEMKNGKPTCVAGKNMTCNLDCDVGHHCEILGAPQCVPDASCELVDCRSGMVCEMRSGKPVCVNKNVLTCATVKCAGGHRCLISPEGTPSCVPSITCANVRCAGPCTDTPNGPQCGPRPQILPISVGPTQGCPSNEEIRPCTNKCNEPFCGDENFARRCAQVCLTPECECKQGFVRDRQRGCVKREDCPKTQEDQDACGVNEERKECASPCSEPFCGDELVQLNCNIAAVCRPSVCECKNGFARDRATNRCVRRDQCPSPTTSPCATRNCGFAMRCIVENGRAKCIPLFQNNHKSMAYLPPPPPSSSEPVKTFHPFPSLPDSCDQVKCLNGGVCVMEQVKCISGPCKPVPKCRGAAPSVDPNEPSVDPNGVPATGYGSVYQPFAESCDQLRCQRGEECSMERVPCFAAPCKKQAVCRPKNTICRKEHEVWDQCYHGCGETCQNRNPTCNDMCGPGGCICDTFYIRDEVSGNCVRLESCPSTSTSSAVPIEKPRILIPDALPSYDSNNQSPFADSCDQLRCEWGEECTMETIPCFVAPCTKQAVCRPKNTVCHKEHEVWDQCYHGCGETCQTRNPTCTEQCGPGGCICDTFYVRDEISGNCIPRESCPSTPESRAIPIEKPRIVVIPDDLPTYDSPVGSLTVPPPQTCENFQCPVGQMCTLPPMACRVPPCTRRPTCVKDPNFLPGDEIVPTCEGHSCPAGEKCQLQEIQCFRAPCHPIPNCVPDMVPPTCTLPCSYGMTCVLETVLCKKAPCPQKPSCRLLQVDPVPNTCAAVQCQFGETCVLEPLPCFAAPCPNRAICRPASQTCKRKNEIWSQCFTGCEATCQTRMKACTLQCGPGGCQCDSGYIRNEITGECVLERDCPRSNCAANEQYDPCFHGCEGTCDNANPACTKQCGPGGCRCSTGFVRDTESMRCVRQTSCPRRNYGGY